MAAKVQITDTELETMLYFYEPVELKMVLLSAINLFESYIGNKKFYPVIFELSSKLKIRDLWKEAEECMLDCFEESAAVQKFRYIGKLCCFLFYLYNDMKQNDYLLDRLKIKDICTNIKKYIENYTDNIDKIIKKCIEENYKYRCFNMF